MNRPTRLTQMGALMVAFFAIALTGPIPEEELDLAPIEELPQQLAKIQPLEEEFADLFLAPRHIKSRISLPSVRFIGNERYEEEVKKRICTYLVRSSYMPSTVAYEVGRALHERDSSRSIEGWVNAKAKLTIGAHRGITPLVARRLGIESSFASMCYYKAEELDWSWNRVRAELSAIREERQAAKA